MAPKRLRAATQDSAAGRLPVAILLRRVLPFVGDARVLQAMAFSCKELCRGVCELPLAHLRQLDGGKHARRLPLLRQPAYMAMTPLRALALLTHNRCEVCGRGRVCAPFQAHWNLFAHDKCVHASLVNAFYLHHDVRERLELAQAPFVTRQLPGGLWAAYFWRYPDSGGVMPWHWTASGQLLLTESEAAELGEQQPFPATPDQRVLLHRIFDGLSYARVAARQMYF